MSDATLTLERVLEETGWAAKYELQGEARGEEKARSEIARNLLELGWTVEQAARTSRLSIEKVQALYEDIHTR